MSKTFANNLIRIMGRTPGAALARAIGVSQSSVSRWLGGKCMPSVDKCIDIAKALGCSLEDLLQGVA